jgi:hypothetical protein
MQFNFYPAKIDEMVAPARASKCQMGFNSPFKGFNICLYLLAFQNEL